MKNYSAAAATAADGPQKKIKYRKVLKGNFYVKCADNTYLPVKAKNGLNSKVSLICFFLHYFVCKKVVFSSKTAVYCWGTFKKIETSISKVKIKEKKLKKFQLF